MPIFQDDRGKLTTLPRIDFPSEKVLQKLIEENLGEIFGCRFVASEFYTGSVHSGRIDTLALDENDNPVIIEYKNVESAGLMNQALFYLHWIRDHKGDFELAARKSIGKSSEGEDVEIDWSYVRVICVAPKFDRYALHAAQLIEAGIELWQFNKYANNVIEMEELQKGPIAGKARGASPAAEKVDEEDEKPAYTFDDHLENGSEDIRPIVHALADYITGLNTSIKVVPQKLYVAYKLAKNVACLVVQKKKAIVYITLDYDETMSTIARDVRDMGHWGTGNLMISIDSEKDLDFACELIQRAYLNASGN